MSEAAYKDHHVHAAWAWREQYDVMYFAFVWPLEKLGLVWNMKIPPLNE